MSGVSFSVHARDGAARTGALSLGRGVVRTPAFMPVGTAGTVKAMYMDQVKALGADIILGNTYHLMLRPGAERVARLGGLHEFGGWQGPILTDSGGFQVMSLAALRKIDADGVTFRSHVDGSMHRLTPERSVEIQTAARFGHRHAARRMRPPAGGAGGDRAGDASCRSIGRSAPRTRFGHQPGKAVFGIVQGGDAKDLRVRSATALAAMDFPGYAIGGLAVGEPQAVMLDMIETVEPHLPAEKPRYLMGVGTPDDLVESVARGIDMFDCVMPTRAGRHGLAYSRFGKVNLRNARHAEDPRPLDEASSCPAARDYSRAYLHHLVRANEILGMMLLTWINLAYYQDLMAGMRSAIAESRFADYRATVQEGWLRGDIEPL